jgi:uncharacterized membrane protein YdjX (TVP38/TMEM64 family)
MTKAETIAMKAMKNERKCSSQPLYRLQWYYYFSAKLVVGREIRYYSIPSFLYENWAKAILLLRLLGVLRSNIINFFILNIICGYIKINFNTYPII